MARERRWIILVEDGRHVTIGRHTDPSAEEIAGSAERLRLLGLGSWVVIMEGHYYSREEITLLLVQELSPCSTGGGWEQAEITFRQLRNDACEAA